MAPQNTQRGAQERVGPTNIAPPLRTVDHGFDWSLMLIAGKCMPVTVCGALGADPLHLGCQRVPAIAAIACFYQVQLWRLHP
jgi:hypothetical protein